MRQGMTWAVILALGIWGILTNSPNLATVLAMPLIASLFRRWPAKVSEAQFQALGDFTLVAFVVVYVLMVNEIEPRREASRTFLFSLPLIFYPLALCRFLFVTGSVPLARLMILTRFKKLGFSRFGNIGVDFGWPYAFIILLASCAPDGDKVFLTFPLLALWGFLVMVLLPSGRSRHWTRLFVLLVGLGMGWSLQLGIQGAEAFIQKQSAEWWKQGIIDPGMEKRATMLGKTAELQLSSAVHLRLQLKNEPAKIPIYLRSSVYDQWSGRELWMNSQDMRPALSNPDGHYAVKSRELRVAPGPILGDMWMEMRGQGWLHLPDEVSSFRSPSLMDVEKVGGEHFRGKSKHDVVRLELFEKEPSESIRTRELSENDLVRYLEMNESRRKTSDEFLKNNGIGLLSPAEMSKAVKGIFLGGDYVYSLEVKSPPPHISVLDFFLNQVKSGHCEYYATATVMLFRARDIPARYCTGYAVHEREGDLWLARGRDAHAWAEVWDGERWLRVETTPPTQFGPLTFRELRRVWESWIFSFEKWRYGAGGDRLAEWAPWMLLLVLLYFGWRFSREWRQGRREKSKKVKAQRKDPGFAIFEKRMKKRQLGRRSHESWWAWRDRLEEGGVTLPDHLCDSWSRWSWDPEYEPQTKLGEELRSLRIES
jgi:protein-glutamine gamma-glutamyltransferase